MRIKTVTYSLIIGSALLFTGNKLSLPEGMDFYYNYGSCTKYENSFKSILGSIINVNASSINFVTNQFDLSTNFENNNESFNIIYNKFTPLNNEIHMLQKNPEHFFALRENLSCIQQASLSHKANRTQRFKTALKI